MTGTVIMDDNADRDADYWLMDLAADGQFAPVAHLHNVRPGFQVSGGY